MPWSSIRNNTGRVLVWLLKPPPENTIRLFKSVVYLVLMANTIFLLPLADRLWGPESLIMPLEHPDKPLYRLFFLMTSERILPHWFVVIALQLTAGILWFVGRWRWWWSLLFYLCTALLFTSAHLYITGGHVLMGLILFYFILIPDRADSDLKRLLANVFLLACKIQLAIVYLFAGLFKLHGEYWLSGEALYYVLSLREFSHPILQDLLLNQPFLLKVGSWLALIYQLAFPVLIWFKSVKLPLLITGIVFHLTIAFGLGLPDFGLFMIISYAMFVNDRAAAKVVRRFSNNYLAIQRSLKRG